MGVFFAILLSSLAIFLVLLVLVQRGRGGGLAGALGGMGGSSAFGAKAGDVFTRITIVTAAIWIAVCLSALFWAKHRGDVLGSSGSTSTSTGSSQGVLPPGPANQQPPGSKGAGESSAPVTTSPAASGSLPAPPSSGPAAPKTLPEAPATPGNAPSSSSSSTPPAKTP
jgi:preprotein translocase subunit SecG